MSLTAVDRIGRDPRSRSRDDDWRPPRPEEDPDKDDDEAPETPLDEPAPMPIQDPPAEPDTRPYTVHLRTRGKRSH